MPERPEDGTVLRLAMQATEDRPNRYGAPIDNLTATAERWKRWEHLPMGPLKAALMMLDFKMARLEACPDDYPTLVDVAGWAHVAGEVVRVSGAGDRVSGFGSRGPETDDRFELVEVWPDQRVRIDKGTRLLDLDKGVSFRLHGFDLDEHVMLLGDHRPWRIKNFGYSESRHWFADLVRPLHDKRRAAIHYLIKFQRAEREAVGDQEGDVHDGQRRVNHRETHPDAASVARRVAELVAAGHRNIEVITNPMASPQTWELASSDPLHDLKKESR